MRLIYIIISVLMIIVSCHKEEEIIIHELPQMSNLESVMLADGVQFSGKINVDYLDNIQDYAVLIASDRETLSFALDKLSKVCYKKVFGNELFMDIVGEQLDIEENYILSPLKVLSATADLDGNVISDKMTFVFGETYYYSMLMGSGRLILSSVLSSFIASDPGVTFDKIEIKDTVTSTFTVKYSDVVKDDILNMGFCWNSTGNPTVADKTMKDLKNVGRGDSIVCSLKGNIITGISYLRAFVERKDGSIFYSQELKYDNTSERGIYTVADFIEFAKSSSDSDKLYRWMNEQGEIVLQADLDLSEITSWTAIGGKSYFSHVFNGNNHKIRNLKFTMNGPSFLFYGIAKEGVIKNLVLSDVDASDLTSSSVYQCDPAGFCAQNYGTIENCTYMGSTISSRIFSAFCHLNWGQIIGCSNNAHIESEFGVNGITHQNSGLLLNCSNNGDIKSSSAFGICSVNHHDPYVENLSNKSGVIKGCINKGSLLGVEYASAFSNKNSGIIENCKNEGIVNSSLEKGHSSGCCLENGSKIISFENRASISGNIAAGVTCSNIYGEILYAINGGDVLGIQRAGGIASLNSSSKIENSTNSGNISANSNEVGGICGYNRRGGAIVGCTSSGYVNSNPSSSNNLIGKNENP